MQAYRFETLFSKGELIKIPLSNQLSEKDFGIIILTKQIIQASKFSPSDFIEKFFFLINDDFKILTITN